MTALRKTEEVRRHLEQMPGIVSVDEVQIEKNRIQSLAIVSRAMGRVTVRKLDVNDAPELFTFYTKGLSEIAKILFAPSSPHSPRSADELGVQNRQLEERKGLDGREYPEGFANHRVLHAETILFRSGDQWDCRPG